MVLYFDGGCFTHPLNSNLATRWRAMALRPQVRDDPGGKKLDSQVWHVGVEHVGVECSINLKT